MRKFPEVFLIFFLLLFQIDAHGQIIERGFGYSSLVHFRRSGQDLNHDRFADFSYAKIFSEKAYDADEGKIKLIYTLPQATELQSAFIVSTDDLNGDGLDEIIVVYNWGNDEDDDGFFDGSKLIAYDGIDGRVMFSYEMQAENGVKNKCLNLLHGDFNGDGKNDVVCLSPIYTNLNGSVIKKGIEIAALNWKGELFYKNVLVPDNDSTFYGYLNSALGDFNADQTDDLLISYSSSEKNSSESDIVKLVLLDIKRNSYINSFTLPNVSSTEILKCGDFTKDGIDEIICAGKDYSSDSSSIEIFNVNGEIYNSYTTENNIDFVFADDFQGDYSPEIVFIENIPSSKFSGYSGIYSLSYLTGVPNLIYGLSGIGGNRINAAFAGEFNDEGKVDIAFATEDATAIGVKIIDFSGNLIFSHQEITQNRSKVVYFSSGDFNGNGKNDIVLAHSWGRDIDDDGYGDNSFLDVIETENDSSLFTYHPFDENSGGYAGYLFAIMKNDISNKELLRSINFDSTFYDLSSIREEFIKRDYNSATDKLFDFYKNYYSFIPIQNKEYYVVNNHDVLERYINEFSVFSGREEPAINSWNNFFRAVSTIALRMKRITSSLWHRLRYSENTFSKEAFLAATKAIYAHLIFSSREDQFSYGTNHGTIFELEGYTPASVTLNIFKDYTLNKTEGWINTLDKRLKVQMDHVLPDGVHDEHSLYYAFRVNLSFNRIKDFQRENSSIFNLPGESLSELDKKITAQNVYLMYAVKPVPIITDEQYVFTQSDIPCIGDTKGVWGTNLYGKMFRRQNSRSFLIYPDYYNNGWQISDSVVVSNLNFSAYGLIDFPNSFSAPEEVSKMFSPSGIFISRSLWKNDNGDFDSLARYCYFKGGEMIPTPGPYYGYSTSSLHGHADLETVEISGYGKNLIQELGGFVNPADTQISLNLSDDDFKNLYGYESSADPFNRARHYFKGTPAHNTVYVNNQDQAEFLGHYAWGGFAYLSRTVSAFSIADELDYYLSGYNKENDYTHQREMFYVKPNINDEITNDYWIFTDNIDFAEKKENQTEQIWNIAPLESDGILDTVSGIYRTSNFAVVPMMNVDNIDLESNLINSFNLTDLILIDTKTLKYKKSYLGKNFKYCTIIFPYQNQTQFIDLSIEKLDVYNVANELVGSNQAIAFKFSFKKWNDIFDDYVLISEKPGAIFKFNVKNQEISSSSKFIFSRFKENSLIKQVSLSWDDVAVNFSTTADSEYSLQQNYPNPFRENTTISFTISAPSKVSLIIYDVLGREIKTLVNNMLDKGDYSFIWDGADNVRNQVASGVYFYRLGVDSKFTTKKIMRVK